MYLVFSLCDFTASIKNTPKEVGVAGSFSYQKDRQYSMEARVLRTTKNKKYTFNPILSVSTPTKDLIDLRGTIHIRAAKSVKFDLTLDRVFTVPLVLKGLLIFKPSCHNLMIFFFKK